MSPASLALGGNMAAESDSGVWSTRENKDDTLTISLKTQWNAGTQRTLTIDATDIAQNPPAALSLSYTVTSRGSVGTLKWRFQTGSWVNSSPAIGADGTLYVGSTDKNLYALNPDGTEKWRFTTGDFVSSAPAIGADGTLYVGANDTNVYALNPDGKEKWRFPTGGNVASSPAIGADGSVYIGSDDAYLYAIQGKTLLSTSAPWPKIRHDNQNTGRVSAGK